jgi:hypothetical protein
MQIASAIEEEAVHGKLRKTVTLEIIKNRSPL